MPLSNSSQTNEVAAATLKSIQDVSGKHPGFRAAHAKGILVSGTFQPTKEAKTLSTAPHLQAPTQVAVRFSNSTGVPQIPDTDANADPRGMAIRFFLGSDRKHTDVIAHSTPFFPVNKGEDFLAFFKAIAAGTVPDFLGSHPAAVAFVQAPKPTPKSFATEACFGVNAFKLINADGKETFIRYRITPDLGVETYESAQLEGKPANFLYDELRERLQSGKASLSLVAQIAEAGDPTNDATIHWPEDRKQVKLGTITLEKVVDDNAELQRTMIFDPIPRIEGIEPSDDPLLDFRASVYLMGVESAERLVGIILRNYPTLSLKDAKAAT